MLRIDEERCKGCGLCVRACPIKILAIDNGRINTRGYHPAYVSDSERCLSCCACALTCPDICIEINQSK